MRRHWVLQEEDESEVNLTPMLDIVFIMLIFFIVTASFVKESGLDVARPSKMAEPKKDSPPSIAIVITDNGQIWMDNRMIDVRTVRANIERKRAEHPKAGVVIQAGTNTRNGLVVKVIDQAKLANVANVSLMDSN